MTSLVQHQIEDQVEQDFDIKSNIMWYIKLTRKIYNVCTAHI